MRGTIRLLRARSAFVIVFAAGITGCSGDSVSTPAECNPLGGVGCITPWPSAIYEAKDDTTVTGWRLDIPADALPTNADGVPIDPVRFNEHDGFSPASFAFTVFEEGVDTAGLVSHENSAASLTAASTTVMIDMTTGKRVEHFAEVDVNALDAATATRDRDRQALYIRPLPGLAANHRYAIGIRTSLKAADGGELAVPAGFAAIRDERATNHERLEGVRGRYAAIFAAFAAEGISPEELVVAWDFTTASEAFLTRDLLQARDAALEAMGTLASEMSYTIDREQVEETTGLRHLWGTFEAPQVVDDVADDGALARDAAGNVVVAGTMEAPLYMMVPACAASQRPVPVLQYGHGFFLTLGEAGSDFLRQMANELCLVVIATDWFGMSEDALAGAALALGDASKLINFGERIIQGIVNQITLEQLIRGPLGQAPELTIDTERLLDPQRVVFYGISQGHILGSSLIAVDPFFSQAILSVGGSNWGLLMERSTNWPTFQLILSGAYSGALNTVIIESLLQLGFDRVENLWLSKRILDNPLPGSRSTQVLMHMGLGDSRVSNIATAAQARVMGIPVLEPAVLVPAGLRSLEGPLESALVVFDEEPTPMPPSTNARNVTENGTHASIRRQPAAIRQIDRFLRERQVVNTCDGPCNCSIGACE